MAVQAAINCLDGIDRSQIDGLFLATTTSPYKEKQASSLVTVAADLGQDIVTADFTNSIRAGTIAFRMAMDSIKAGTLKHILVVASDCRLATPNSDLEAYF